MTSTSPYHLRVSPYTSRLKEFFKEALCENFGPDKPHALVLTMHGGDKARMVDFAAWRKKGSGSHQSQTLTIENDSIRDALSVAAFDIAGDGGFIGALPRSYELPTYYFLTHAIVAYDRSFVRQYLNRTHKPKDIKDILFTAQSAGTSAHLGLKAVQQIETVLETVLRGQLDLTSDEI